MYHIHSTGDSNNDKPESNNVSHTFYRGFWVKEPLTPSKLNSYNELRTAMVSGETVRFVVTTKGCKCPPGENCGDVYVGGYVKGNL